MPEAALIGSEADKVVVKRALISVSDKKGLEELGKFLYSKNIEILSTGGTAKALRACGVEVVDVSEYTKFPEIEDGRVKTLHPKIHGGILGVRGNSSHESEMSTHGIHEIDLVIVNLYPFVETVAQGLSFPMCIENIDIGGPSMIRSAAKNHRSVVVVTDPSQYERLQAEMSEDCSTCYDLRKTFASQAFAKTASYDNSISEWFEKHIE